LKLGNTPLKSRGHESHLSTSSNQLAGRLGANLFSDSTLASISEDPNERSSMMSLSPTSMPYAFARSPQPYYGNQDRDNSMKFLQYENALSQTYDENPLTLRDYMEPSNSSSLHSMIVGQSPNPTSVAATLAQKDNFDNSDLVFNEAKSPFDNTKVVFNEAKSPLDNTKIVFNEVKSPSDNAKVVFNDAKSPFDNAKVVFNDAKSPFDNAKVVFNEVKSPLLSEKVKLKTKSHQGSSQKTPINSTNATPNESKTPRAAPSSTKQVKIKRELIKSVQPQYFDDVDNYETPTNKSTANIQKRRASQQAATSAKITDHSPAVKKSKLKVKTPTGEIADTKFIRN
jgi:hypothetical protein